MQTTAVRVCRNGERERALGDENWRGVFFVFYVYKNSNETFRAYGNATVAHSLFAGDRTLRPPRDGLACEKLRRVTKTLNFTRHQSETR